VICVVANRGAWRGCSRKGRQKSSGRASHITATNGWSLRDLRRILETPGANRLRDAHAALDTAVRAAYGMKEQEETLAFLLRLNLELAGLETIGQLITQPGLSAAVLVKERLISSDRIEPMGLEGLS
jgi:hypothetical protein